MFYAGENGGVGKLQAIGIWNNFAGTAIITFTPGPPVRSHIAMFLLH